MGRLSSKGPWKHLPRPGLIGRNAKTWCGLPWLPGRNRASKECPQCARAAARGK